MLLAFVSDSARLLADLRGPDAPPVRRVLDIGSGPGVGTCELARLFPHAHVVAVDGSPAMLDRTMRRAAIHGLGDRITTHLAELPDRLEGVEPVDVIWASMSLHHVGDETAALRQLRDLLGPFGLLALAELAEPTRVLPDDLDVGRPGLADRLEKAQSDWFAAMRAGLPGSVSSSDLQVTVISAGFDIVVSRLRRQHFDAPLSPPVRQLIIGHVRRAREHLEQLLEVDDLATLDLLCDPDNPQSVMNRPDVFLASSRQLIIARPRQQP